MKGPTGIASDKDGALACSEEYALRKLWRVGTNWVAGTLTPLSASYNNSVAYDKGRQILVEQHAADAGIVGVIGIDGDRKQVAAILESATFDVRDTAGNYDVGQGGVGVKRLGAPPSR